MYKVKKRHLHNLSHQVNTTLDLGNLVPIANYPVLPGDIVKGRTTCLIRLAPMVRPIMHPIEARIHHFYVKYSDVWTGWEDFITGDSATPPPQFAGGTHYPTTLMGYLGVYGDTSNSVNKLHHRAYNKIYNQEYRDQDLISEVSEDSDAIKNVAWAKDNLTAARPWTQKGTSVTIPLGTSAPVSGIFVRNAADAGAVSSLVETPPSSQTSITDGWQTSTLDVFIEEDGTTSDAPGIYADLSNADGPDAVDFREAMAIHTYQENAARYGSDYVDYLARYGVAPKRADLDRAVYLGGGKATLQISEVLNQGDLTGDIGDMFGHGITPIQSNKYGFFVPEHGVIMTMLSLRPKNIYCHGIPKEFSKQAKEDYYQFELEHVGQDEVYNREVYAAHSNPTGVHGYNDRYHEYRHINSYATGNFTQAADDDWGLWRLFTGDTALNETFVTCTPNERIFADASIPHAYVMAHHNIRAKRFVKRVANPMMR